MTPTERRIKECGGIWTEEGWVVEKSLDLYDLNLTVLPKIKSVGGNFWCWNNPLASLSSFPNKIGGNFWCGYNLSFPKEEIILLIKAHPRNLKEIIKRIRWI